MGADGADLGAMLVLAEAIGIVINADAVGIFLDALGFRRTAVIAVLGANFGGFEANVFLGDARTNGAIAVAVVATLAPFGAGLAHLGALVFELGAILGFAVVGAMLGSGDAFGIVIGANAVGIAGFADGDGSGAVGSPSFTKLESRHLGTNALGFQAFGGICIATIVAEAFALLGDDGVEEREIARELGNSVLGLGGGGKQDESSDGSEGREELFHGQRLLRGLGKERT